MKIIPPFISNNKSLAYNCELNVLKCNLLLVAIKKSKSIDCNEDWPGW